MKLFAILVVAAYSILPLASGAQPTAPDQSTSTDQQTPNRLFTTETATIEEVMSTERDGYRSNAAQ